MAAWRYSVALCTYNGERFLEPQLAGIRAQTRLPDELVVCDDASTDRTVEILERFRSDAPFPVHIFIQPANVGSVRNFEKAIRSCAGDLIALSDQDDIWMPRRLAASEGYLKQDARAAFVFTDGQLIDQRGAVQSESLWARFGFGPSLQERLGSGDYSVLLRHRFITGATITLRREALNRLLPFPQSWVHDEWIAALTPFYADIGMLREPLLQYRLHAAQQVGAQKVRRNRADLHWAHIERQHLQMRELFDHLSLHPPTRRPDLVRRYRERAEALQRRVALSSSRFERARQVMRNLPEYTGQAAGYLSALKDILLAKPIVRPSAPPGP